MGALEPEAASEKAITVAGLVRHKAELVRRGTSEDGVASGCTNVLARLCKGGKILTAESTLLDAELWTTGASLTKSAELHEAELWCTVLCLTFNVLARLHKGGEIQIAVSTLLDAELWTTGASSTKKAELQGAEL